MAESKIWVNPNPDSPFQTRHSTVKPLMGQAATREKKKAEDMIQGFESPWLKRVLKRLGKK